jgi:hypothetical protein
MNRWKVLVTVLALCVGMSGVALAQDNDHDRDDQKVHRDRDDHRAKHDRDDDRGRRQDRDRDDYRYGNNNGYYGNNNGYYNGQYGRYPYGRNNGYYGNGQYGYYGRGGYGNQAAQIGYRDGVNDGRNDRATGHSFRPTQDSSYRHASNGYNGAYGSKGAYQQDYRQAYEQGYQAGYGQAGYGYGNRAGWPWGR